MKFLVILIILMISLSGFSQKTSQGCKSVVEELSQNYEGDCKKGLAHGEGNASGVDSYKGEFRKGYPHGKGIYKWENGNVYDGNWVMGEMEGRGRLTLNLLSPDSIQDGFWRGGRYLGTENIPSYKVIASRNMVRQQIRRTGDGNELKIVFLRQGGRNTIINNLSIAVNNGSVNTFTSDALVVVNSFPINCRISYQTLDNGGVSTLDVLLEFLINDPGSWNVTLSH